MGEVNSLLCRLRSRMNEAQRLGRNQGQLARCSLGCSEDIYCLSPTLPASSFTPNSFFHIFCPAPFTSLHVSSFPRQKTASASGQSRLLPPAQGIYRLPLVAWHSLTLRNNSHVMLAAANAVRDALRPCCVFCFFCSLFPPLLLFNIEPLPVGGPPLAVLIHLQHDLRGVQRRAGVGVQQKLLVLGQILSWGLLGKSGAVQQLSLQQG